MTSIPALPLGPRGLPGDSSDSRSGGPAPPVRLSLRDPDDVMAAVPVILGFEPAESMVMLTFGGAETFHARVDLPRSRRVSELAETLDLLVEPAVHHRVRTVLLVVYTADRIRARDAERRLRRAFDAAGIEVVEVLHSDGSRWSAGGRCGDPPGGVGYDAGGHRFRAESVGMGRVVHRSREELMDLLDAAPGGHAVAEALRRVDPLGTEAVPEVLASGGRRGRFADDELAGLLLGLRELDVRDAAWGGLSRASAEGRLPLWVDAVQRAPDHLVAAPAAVLAMTAWLAGHGALAWCAIDRSRAAEPANTLAALVAELLMAAVPPSAWDAVAEPP